MKSPTIDIAQLKIDLGLSATKLYRASSSDDVINQISYSLTGDTNFYATPNVVEITTQAGLADINATAATLGGKYILLKDIALNQTGAGFEATYGWKPMGTFTGIFNGNGHKITGLWIDRPSTDLVGFFDSAKGAVIKNIGVEIANGKTVKGKDLVGGIVGDADDSNITNVYTTGNISGNEYVGGIAGFVVPYGTITNSYSTGNISGSEYVGGILGRTDGPTTNNYTTGNISGSKYVGGIAGGAYGLVTNSYATGDVSGTSSDVGGIAGSTTGITNSYATGDVSGTSNVGGIVGSAYGDITYSYATGDVSGSEKVGGIAGYAEDPITNNAAINPSVSASVSDVNKIVGSIGIYSTINNNFALNTMSIAPNGSGDAGTAKTIVGLKTKSTYETDLGWLFGSDDTNPWKIDANKNGGLPYLYYQDQ